jgi:hypothetical protein
MTQGHLVGETKGANRSDRLNQDDPIKDKVPHPKNTAQSWLCGSGT